MITELFYINNSQVNPPKNWQELMIELNYGKDQFPQGNTVSVTDFEWCRENYDYFQKYIADGLTGGVGIFEAPPFRIDVTNGKVTKNAFNGFIDLTTGAIFTNKKGNLPGLPDGVITAKAVSHASVDWLNDVAGGFTFEYLTSLSPSAAGAITSDMYRFMPYVNNSVPNYQQAAIATLMVYNVSQAIVKAIEEIAGIIADAAGYFTTIPAVIKLILKIAYLIVLIITLIKLVEDMIKFIISPIKYHAGMLVRDSLAKGCEFLNMKFVSDIWESNSPYYNEFIIPEKLYNPTSKKDNQILGFLKPEKNSQYGFYKGTFAQLLEAMKVKYNAKIVVTVPEGGATPTNQGTVTLLRKDKNAKPPSYQLPDIYTPQYTYNTDELQANTLIEFQTDSLDTNTLQNYQGTLFQVICQPKVVNYQPFVMMKNYVNIQIPFARASVKTDLTVPENILEDFLSVFDDIANVLVTIINAVITVINAIMAVVKKIFKFFGIKIKINPIPKLKKLNLAQAIENRKGMMVLSSDHFSVPKIFILKEGSESKYNKIDPLNAVYQTAQALWESFYYVNSFVPSPGRPAGNQYMIKEFPKVPFTWSNFLQVISNNRIFDANGNTAILESLKFNPYKQVASMKVRFSQLYTTNLHETFLNPSGD